MKYKDDKTVLDAISEVAAEFIKGRKLELDFIVPAPASRTRAFQPVLEIAKGISSRLGLPLCNDCITKVKNTPQLKNIDDYAKRPKLLEDAFSADPVKLEDRNLLLFDDLYQSGATLTAMTAMAYAEGKAANVYVLALTRTRSA